MPAAQKKLEEAVDAEFLLDDEKVDLEEFSGDEAEEGTFRLGQADEVGRVCAISSLHLLSCTLKAWHVTQAHQPQHVACCPVQEFHDYGALALKDDAQNRFAVGYAAAWCWCPSALCSRAGI